MKYYSLSKQHGVAIITALLIVALAATTATYLLWQQSLWTRQVENLSARSKANAVALAASQLARGQLNEFADTKNFYPLLGKPVPLAAEGASLVGMLVDEQAKFNVNNLIYGNEPPPSPTPAPTPAPTGQGAQAKPPAPPNPGAAKPRTNEELFQKLLEELKLPPALTDSLKAWISENGQQQDDLDYLSLNPPYRSAHRRMVDINELYRVKGFTPEIVEKLRPYITALRNTTALNLNTAPDILLVAAGMEESLVARIIKKRESSPFLKTEDLKGVLPDGTVLPYTVGLSSQYFVASGRVSTGNVDIGYSALLERPSATAPGAPPSTAWPVIIWQQQGLE